MTNDEYRKLIDFLGERFGRIDQRFLATNARFDRVDDRFDHLEERVASA